MDIESFVSLKTLPELENLSNEITNILTKKPYMDELKSKQNAGKKKRTRKSRISRKTNKKIPLKKSRKTSGGFIFKYLD